MNREERRQLFGRVRAGIATARELKAFGKSAEDFIARAQGRDAWRETLRVLVATALPSKETRNKRKARLRSRSRRARPAPVIAEVTIGGKRFKARDVRLTRRP